MHLLLDNTIIYVLSFVQLKLRPAPYSNSQINQISSCPEVSMPLPLLRFPRCRGSHAIVLADLQIGCISWPFPPLPVRAPVSSSVRNLPESSAAARLLVT